VKAGGRGGGGKDLFLDTNALMAREERLN